MVRILLPGTHLDPAAWPLGSLTHDDEDGLAYGGVHSSEGLEASIGMCEVAVQNVAAATGPRVVQGVEQGADVPATACETHQEGKRKYARPHAPPPQTMDETSRVGNDKGYGA